MTEKLYFENVETHTRFELVEINEDQTEVKLRSEYGEFYEEYSKERFKQLGYKLVRVQEGDDA